MPQDDFSKGFTGAFTWENIGMQVANGIISGGASFAVGMLLKTLTQQNQDMSKMFQSFADQIVERLSAKMKEIITMALFQDNMKQLLNASIALEDEYRFYLTVREKIYLDDIVQKTFLINQDAKSLGIPALGIYCVQKTIQIAVYFEESRFDNSFFQAINDEIVAAEKHINDLQAEAYQKIKESFSETVYHHSLTNPMEPDEFWRYRLFYEGAFITEVESPKSQKLDNLVKDFRIEKQNRIHQDVFQPALDIINKLKDAPTNLN